MGLLDKLRQRETTSYAHFAILPDRVTEPGKARGSERFIRRESYFSLRLAQMRLRNSGEYFRDFIPMTSSLTRISFQGKMQEIPAVVSPKDLLANAKFVDKSDQVEFLNIRLMGPYPYAGDEVRVFVGLFRSVSNDWAKQSLDLLGAVGKAVPLGQLSQYVDVAGAIATGVEGLLGLKDVELRIGFARDMREPPKKGAMPSTSLQPGYFVMMRIPSTEVSEAQRRQFWVHEGRLFFGDDKATLKDYTGSDFLLYEFEASRTRPDYERFPFHATFWKNVVQNLDGGSLDEAQKNWDLLRSDLYRNDDIQPSQRTELLAFYFSEYKRLRKEAERFGALPTRAGGTKFESVISNDLLAAIALGGSAKAGD